MTAAGRNSGAELARLGRLRSGKRPEGMGLHRGGQSEIGRAAVGAKGRGMRSGGKAACPEGGLGHLRRRQWSCGRAE